MLFDRTTLRRIRAGEITVAFRSWTRPTVTAGGTLTTSVGVLAIDEVTPVEPGDITLDDARAAGYERPEDVVASLRAGRDRRPDRIRFHRVGDDPRNALSLDADLDDDELEGIAAQLGSWDRASRGGPWTHELLTRIATQPERPARLLAEDLGIDTARLKRRVRQLTSLGLTHSLDTGYRVAPRGAAYLASIDRRETSGRG
jgi:hypothetical protein